MTLPPMPPPDPLSGVPGGDPLGPIPGSQPPPQYDPPREPEADPMPVPEQRAGQTVGPDTAPPLWQRPEITGQRQPEPSIPQAPTPGTPAVPTPRKARGKTKFVSGVVSLAALLGVLWGGGVFSGAGALLSGDSDHEEDAAVPDPQEVRLSAAEHYSQEFELAAEIGGSAVVDRLDAWDHAGCDGIVASDILDTTLPDAGCDYAVEGAYERADLDVALSQYILVFDKADGAEAVAKQFDPDSLAEDVTFSSDARGGARAGLVDAVDEYVVLTVGELGSEDEAEDASDVIGYFHVENTNVMRFT